MHSSSAPRGLVTGRQGPSWSNSRNVVTNRGSARGAVAGVEMSAAEAVAGSVTGAAEVRVALAVVVLTAVARETNGISVASGASGTGMVVVVAGALVAGPRRAAVKRSPAR